MTHGRLNRENIHIGYTKVSWDEKCEGIDFIDSIARENH
jgi:hypothetical protein